MNTNQYLDEAFYRNISTSEDKTFDFADDKSIKYRNAVVGSENVFFQVKTFRAFRETVHQPEIYSTLLGKAEGRFGFNHAI